MARRILESSDEEENGIAEPSTEKAKENVESGKENEVEQPVAGPSKEVNPERVVSRKQTKRRDHYSVEKILDRRMNREEGIDYFLIKWNGYPDAENSWEPRKNLRGCKDLLDAYLTAHNYPPSELVPLVGAIGDDEDVYNTENWVVPDQIIRSVEIYGNKRNLYGSPELTEYPNSLGDTSGLYLYILGSHAYVIAHVAEKKTVYVADGANNFIDSEEAKGKILEALRPKPQRVVALEFMQQRIIDGCGSAAVVIALEFKRLFNAKDWPERALIIPKSDYERIVATLHKDKSNRLCLEKGTSGIPRNKCRFCGRGFKAGYNRNALLTHERSCKSNE